MSSLYNWAAMLWSITLMLSLPGCASLPPASSIPQEKALPPGGALHQLLQPQLQSHPDQSAFILLPNGLDAYAARAALIQAAERSIDLQYYLFHNDMIGRLTVEQLLQAADRGVRVRILLDDFALRGVDRHLLALNDHPQIEIRLFNPFANRSRRLLETVIQFGRINRRMHNKSLTADGIATIVGGRNIGNEYYEADPEVAFGDLDILGAGPVAAEVTQQFDLYWNSGLAYPVDMLNKSQTAKKDLPDLRAALKEDLTSTESLPYQQRLRDSDFIRKLHENSVELHWGHSDVVWDAPDKITRDSDNPEGHLTPQLKPLITELRKELIIFSPYFIPGDAGVKELAALVKQGIRVRIITNSLASTDVSAVHAGYAGYRKALLKAGVELFEAKVRPGQTHGLEFGGSSRASLHAKTFVFDRQKLFVGSLNLDPRSTRINTELGVVFDSAALASGIADWIDDNLLTAAYRLELQDDKLVWRDLQQHRLLTKEPDTNWLTRSVVWMMSLLPIESQL